MPNRKGEHKIITDLISHYNHLIDEGQDPVKDPPELQAYMDKWDGETFIKLLALNKTKNTLEIGCGTGRLAVRVAPHVRFFCGVDISSKTIEIAKSHLQNYNAELICDDFLTHSFTKKLDLIYSSLTFMHFETKYKVIEKIYNLLTANGICVLSLDKNQNSILDFGIRQIKIYPDDPEETMNMFLKCGFREIEKHEIDYAYLIRAKRK